MLHTIRSAKLPKSTQRNFHLFALKGYHPDAYAGPALQNLQRYALNSMERHPDDGAAWLLTFADGRKDVFVDPNDSVAIVRSWLDAGVRSFYAPWEFPMHPTVRRPPPAGW